MISGQVERIAPRFVCNFGVPFEWASTVMHETVSIPRFFSEGMPTVSNAPSNFRQ